MNEDNNKDLNEDDEKFSNETPNRTSLEGYVGSEVNLFDIGDFSLLSNLYVYAGPEHKHAAQQPKPLDVAALNVKNSRR